MSRRLLTVLAALLALLLVLGCYSWSIWRSPAFGWLADQAYHLALALDFDRAWRDGEFPPRWAAGMNGGRGSLGFVIYPPLFSFVTASWLRVVPSEPDALRWAVLTVTAGLFGAVYFLARAWLAPWRSILAATLVPLLPGTTFIALGRGMFPNYAGLLWVALLLGAGQRVVAGHRPRLYAAGMVLAGIGLVLTHTLTAYLLTLLLIVASPLLWRTLSRRQWLVSAVLATGVLLLTAWYWIPLIHAGTYTQVEYLAASHPYLESVFWGPAGGAGNEYGKSWAFLNQMGRYVVVAQSLLALALVLVLHRTGVAAAAGGSAATGETQPLDRILFLRALPWVAGFAFLAAIGPAAALLVHLPQFDLIQFCWRWQMLVALWCGVGLASLPRTSLSGLPASLGAVVVLFFLPILSAADTHLEDIDPSLPAAIHKEQLDQLKPIDRAAYGRNSFELRPNAIDWSYYLPAEPGRVEVIAGEAVIEPEVIRTSYRRYRVETADGATLRLITYHCRGWTATLDGQPVTIQIEPDTGLQRLQAPAGRHRLEVEYRVAWPW